MTPLILDPQWIAEIEEALEYVSLIDADGNLIYVNHTGGPPDVVAGQSVYDFVDPAYHALLSNAVETARNTGIPQHYNSYAVNADEKRSYYSNWVMALHPQVAEGVVVFLATDVTQLTRVEEELQLSESTLVSMVENSPDTIFVFDRDRTLRFVSKIGYGFETSQIIGLKADQFIPSDELPAAIALFERVLLKGVNESYEAAIRTPAGERVFNARLAPIKNRDQIDRVMVVVTDVTDSRKAEQVQSQLREQLQQAQKMEAIGQLTGGVAHDFNNLLLTISGNLELAQISSDNPEEIESHIHEALKGVQRARDLTQRLLAFSRRQPLSPEALDIAGLVDNMDTLLRRTLGENILIHMDTSQARDRICRVDRAQLENAILNLALNARDAMPDGGELSLSAEWVSSDESPTIDAPFGCVRISVSDSGIGMDEQTVEQSIDPFFTTKEAGEGSGLGLSMVYGFVQQSSGVLRIKSELKQGTVVEVDLPCIADAVECIDKSANPHDVPKGSGELILLVEDDESVREVTAKLLEGLGYQMLTAENGVEAFKLINERTDIQLVITDVVMPAAISGFELADRCHELKPDLPIMLVSGHPLDKRASQYRQQWLNVLLQKPYRSEELARFVAKMLDGGGKG